MRLINPSYYNYFCNTYINRNNLPSDNRPDINLSLKQKILGDYLTPNVRRCDFLRLRTFLLSGEVDCLRPLFVQIIAM